MKSQRYQKFPIIHASVILALLASVDSASHWPTPEFFDRYYRNVAPPPSELTPNTASNTNNANLSPGSTAASVPIPSREADTKPLKQRWANHRRLSAREAVEVMEKELQRREAAKRINTAIKNTDDIQPAASNMDTVAAPSNRRSGHHMGITGPVHTFVKTDKHGHYKWGVRHHAGHGFSR